MTPGIPSTAADVEPYQVTRELYRYNGIEIPLRKVHIDLYINLPLLGPS